MPTVVNSTAPTPSVQEQDVPLQQSPDTAALQAGDGTAGNVTSGDVASRLQCDAVICPDDTDEGNAFCQQVNPGCDLCLYTGAGAAGEHLCSGKWEGGGGGGKCFGGAGPGPGRR